MKTRSVIVIGAGIGGLTAAIHLAQRGLHDKRYNLVRGSTHGLAHTLTQMAYLRPSNRHPRYRNLYFVGASMHPGTGMPTAMVSGRLVAERIMGELGA